VQKAIKEKKECFRPMHLDRSVNNIKRYKVIKKTAKRAVSEARGRMYDGLYQRLDTKEGEKDIYRMAKSTKMKISRTGGGSISTNSSMKTVGARPLS
jgi:hypothetical protein